MSSYHDISVVNLNFLYKDWLGDPSVSRWRGAYENMLVIYFVQKIVNYFMQWLYIQFGAKMKQVLLTSF